MRDKRPTVAYEENGVRVMMGRPSSPILIQPRTRMSVEEARAHIAAVNRAIMAYCHELDKQGATW